MATNFIQNLLRRNKNQDDIQVVPIQLDENGQIDPVASARLDLDIKQKSTPLTLSERFLTGRDMTQDYQTINPETGKAEMATLTNKRSGLIPDVVSGFRENYAQGFNANNLVPQNKGFATRLGEGLGTIGRFADSPLGRGLIAYGLSNAVDDTNPLEQAITAGVGRYNNQTADKIYRNQLKQMGMDESELNAIRGDVTKDVFNSIVSGMRYNNQRVTWGQLAQISPEIAEMIEQNPELENTFIPINLARDIYGLKRETAQGKMAETKAKTEKTQAETKQVGKPKVSINIKQGGTTSRIVHEGGSSKPTKPERPTRTAGTGRPRVGNQQYTQEEIREELIRRRLINANN